MKKLITIISLITLMTLLLVCQNAKSSSVVQSTKDSINVWSSAELVNLATMWTSKYSKPDKTIKVVISSTKDITDNIKSEGNIGIVNKYQITKLNIKPIWSIVLGHDIIVPVMNSQNPVKDEILKQGLSFEDFAKLYSSSENLPWKLYLNDNENSIVNCYYINDEPTKYYMTDFMQVNESQLKAHAVENVDMMLNDIQNDVYAIGFCRLVDVVNFEDQELNENISIIPIDQNADNVIDYKEDIYKDYKTFTNNVWLGKYPRTLYDDIYAVADYMPVQKNEIALLKWIITDGQQYLLDHGYSKLTARESQLKVQSLYDIKTPVTDIQNKPQFSTTLVLLIILAAVSALMIYVLFGNKKTETFSEIKENPILESVFSENTLQAPRGLFYDKSHTWAFMEKNGLVKIGIDDFLLKVTGSVNHIKMKKQGEKILKGEPAITIIQNGKQLKINSPITGVIKNCNIDLDDDISSMNNSPYNDGWVYSIEPVNWFRDMQFLITVDKYKEWLKNEFSRLKDFLTNIKLSGSMGLEPVILQDGGEFKVGILKDLKSEVWEDFQSCFMDILK